jgi:hypothetical protein
MVLQWAVDGSSSDSKITTSARAHVAWAAGSAFAGRQKGQTMLAERGQVSFATCPSQYNILYLSAYLVAVTGCLRQRGLTIHTAELTPSSQILSCNVTFSSPGQPVGFNVPAWVAYHASWNEHRGWCCELHHIAHDRSSVRRYITGPLVPAPAVVADVIVGLSRVQTLGNLGAAEPGARYRHTAQELADDLTRFTPTCTWIG